MCGVICFKIKVDMISCSVASIFCFPEEGLMINKAFMRSSLLYSILRDYVRKIILLRVYHRKVTAAMYKKLAVTMNSFCIYEKSIL